MCYSYCADGKSTASFVEGWVISRDSRPQVQFLSIANAERHIFRIIGQPKGREHLLPQMARKREYLKTIEEGKQKCQTEK